MTSAVRSGPLRGASSALGRVAGLSDSVSVLEAALLPALAPVPFWPPPAPLWMAPLVLPSVLPLVLPLVLPALAGTLVVPPAPPASSVSVALPLAPAPPLVAVSGPQPPAATFWALARLVASTCPWETPASRAAWGWGAGCSPGSCLRGSVILSRIVSGS